MNTIKAGLVNYKTTLCGLGIAILTAVANYDGHGGAKGYLLAVGVAAYGFFSHDAH